MSLFVLCLGAIAGAAEVIPPAEMQALDRAIRRELNSGQTGSQTLGDLRRLKQRLTRIQQSAGEGAETAERQTALQPLAGGDTRQQLLDRLQEEAKVGGRPARRSLALYYVFLNEPEKALREWRAMGRANDSDLPYSILSAYLELALGEYNNGRNNLESALRRMDSRTSLVLSVPVFCSNIAGYRIYTARAEGDLLPGEEVLVYVEAEGAEFGPAPGGGRECRLMFGLTLKNDQQTTMWTELNYGEYAPVFAGDIRDLHAALTWRVPNDLPPGRYHLTIQAVEEPTKRFGENLLSFNVGRRATNPDQRPTSFGMPTAGMDERMREAERVFQGVPQSGGDSNARNLWESEFGKQQQHEIVRQHERSQRVE